METENRTQADTALLLDSQLCFPLYACAREVVKRYRPFLDDIGLTYTQYITMMVLWETPCVSSRQLGRRLFLDSGTLTPLLKKLEAKGLLTREKAQDRRGNLLRITDAGRQAIPQVDTEEQDDPFAPLTDDQQNQLAALLRSLLTAWVDDMEPASSHGRRLPPFHHDKPVEI